MKRRRTEKKEEEFTDETLHDLPPFGHEKNGTKPCFCRVCLEYWKNWIDEHPMSEDTLTEGLEDVRAKCNVDQNDDSPETDLRVFAHYRKDIDAQMDKKGIHRWKMPVDENAIDLSQKKRRSSKRKRRR